MGPCCKVLSKKLLPKKEKIYNYDEATRKRQPPDGSHKSGCLVECFCKKNSQQTETLHCCAGWHAWLNSAFRTVRKNNDKKHQVLERPFALCLPGVCSVKRVREIHCAGNLDKPITLRIHLGAPFYCNFPGVPKEVISLTFSIFRSHLTMLLSQQENISKK